MSAVTKVQQQTLRTIVDRVHHGVLAESFEAFVRSGDCYFECRHQKEPVLFPDISHGSLRALAHAGLLLEENTIPKFGVWTYTVTGKAYQAIDLDFAEEQSPPASPAVYYTSTFNAPVTNAQVGAQNQMHVQVRAQSAMHALAQSIEQSAAGPLQKAAAVAILEKFRSHPAIVAIFGE